MKKKFEINTFTKIWSGNLSFLIVLEKQGLVRIFLKFQKFGKLSFFLGEKGDRNCVPSSVMIVQLL